MLIDFHAHILPNMDDGSKSIEESVRMLEAAWKQGVHKIVCTPHFLPLSMTVPEFLQKRESKQALLQSAIEAYSGPRTVPELVMGAECGWVKNLSRYPDLEALCIENTRFLLMELPMRGWTDELFEELYRLNTQRGIYPIIAHPNRYSRSIKEQNAVSKFVQLDCLFQINNNSLLSYREKKFNLKLLSGPVPCIMGSDIHNDKPDAQRVSQAIEVIGRKLGPDLPKKINAVSKEVINNASPALIQSIWRNVVLVP